MKKLITQLLTIACATLTGEAWALTISETPLAGKAGNILLWLDATETTSITTNEEGKVTQWADLSGANHHATPQDGVTLGTIETVNGASVFQMGAVGSGIDMSFPQQTTIRTVFWVMDIKNSANAFFLADETNYHFHRGGGGQYFHGSYAHENIRNGKLYCDGIQVTNPTASNPPTGLHVYALKTTGNVTASRFAQDRTENGRNGGRAIAELILLDAELTDDEVLAMSESLFAKWVGKHDYVIDVNSSDIEKTMERSIGPAQTLTIDGTGATAEAPLEVSGKLVIDGQLITKGHVKISYGTIGQGSGLAVNGSMTVENGVAEVKFADRGISGTLTIAKDATLKPYGYVDAVKYDGSSTVNVYGTLDMSDTYARWTLRQTNVMNFYAGSTAIGNGQSGANTGAIQFNNSANCVLNFLASESSDTVVMGAMLHAQNPFTMNVAEGVVVTMNGSLGTGKNPMTVTGAGKIVVTSAYEFNGAVTINENATVEFQENGLFQNGVTGTGKVIWGVDSAPLGKGGRDIVHTFAAGATVVLSPTPTEAAEQLITLKTLNDSVSGLKFMIGEAEMTATLEEGEPNIIKVVAVDPAKVIMLPEGTTKIGTEGTEGEIGQPADDMIVIVPEGATFDINGRYDDTGFTVVLKGGTLTNTRAIPSCAGKRQLWNITVVADSKIVMAEDFGTIAGQWGEHVLPLNGNTLTFEGPGTFHLCHVNVTGGGSLVVNSGELVADKGFRSDSDLSLEVAEGAAARFVQNAALTTFPFASITGAGTVATPVLPTASAQNMLRNAETWTGTLVLSGSVRPNLANFANASSKYVMNGVTMADIPSATSPAPIELVDNGDNAAMTFQDWGSGINFSAPKLTGSGTLKTIGFSWYAYYGAFKIADMSEFKGSVNFANHTKGGMWVVSGTETPVYPSGNDNMPHGAILVSANSVFGLGGSANSLNANNQIKGTIKAWTAAAELQTTADFIAGSAIDLSEPDSMLTLPEAATGATTVMVGERALAAGEKLIAWTAKPAAFTAKLEKGTGFALEERDDGLYTKRNSFVFIVK